MTDDASRPDGSVSSKGLGAWQPIETAPTNKTRFLVRYEKRIAIGWFDGKDLYLDGSADEYGHRPVCHGGMYGRVATHWKPLPARR